MSEDKVVYDWANLEDAAKVLAETYVKGYREGLQAAAKVVCKHCHHNRTLYQIDKPKIHSNGFVHLAKNELGFDIQVRCQAEAIHKLLAAADQPGQGQGGEKGD